MFKKHPEEKTATNITPPSPSRPALTPTPPTPAPQMVQKPLSTFPSPSRHGNHTPQAGGNDAEIAGYSGKTNRQNTRTRTLIIKKGITVQGKILNAESVIVEGVIETDHLEVKEIIISSTGLFQGILNVETADIAGTVDGTMTVRNSLTLQNTGRLLGDAECRTLQVENGGQITGKINVIPASSSSSETPTPPMSETQKAKAAKEG